MNKDVEGVLAILAAFVVLLGSMWEPLISAMVAAGGLFLIGIYEITKKRRS